MRRFLFLGLLLAGAGCQGLHERTPCRSDCKITEPCAPVEKKPVSAPPEKVAAPAAPVGEAGGAAVAQEVLLVPRTVYVPFVAQTPIAPMRVSGGAQPGALPAPVGAPKEEAPKATIPAPNPEVPCDMTKQMLEICKKLNERLDCLERKTQERIICVPPAAQPCPPPTCAPACSPASWLPLFRRPLFNRCELLESRELNLLPMTTPTQSTSPETLQMPHPLPNNNEPNSGPVIIVK